MNGKMEPIQVFNEEVSLDVQVEEIFEYGGLSTRAKESTTSFCGC